jgi:hypothetical protein
MLPRFIWDTWGLEQQCSLSSRHGLVLRLRRGDTSRPKTLQAQPDKRPGPQSRTDSAGLTVGTSVVRERPQVRSPHESGRELFSPESRARIAARLSKRVPERARAPRAWWRRPRTWTCRELRREGPGRHGSRAAAWTTSDQRSCCARRCGRDWEVRERADEEESR